MVDNIKQYEPGYNCMQRFATNQMLNTNIAKLRNESFSLLLAKDLISNISLSLIPIVNEYGKIGFIDHCCNLVVPPIYDNIKGCFLSDEHIVAVSKNKKWTVLDSKGKELLPFEYSTIHPSRDSSIVSTQRFSKWQVVDIKSGKVIVEEGLYDYIDGFRYGFARVKKNGLWGVIKNDGKLVLPTEYLDLMDFYYNGDKPETRIRKSSIDTWQVVNLLTL